MSTKKKDCEKTDVLGKLEKAADSLESASNQLSGVVTQQQLDLVRDRVILCETDLVSSKGGLEILAVRTAVHADEADVASLKIINRIETLERDFAGLRALTLTSFALSTISIMGLIVLAVL